MHIKVLLCVEYAVEKAEGKTSTGRRTKTTSFWSVVTESLPALKTQSTRVLNDSISPVCAFLTSTTRVMVGFVKCCHSCSASVRRSKLPALALANYCFLGVPPPELKELSFVEEQLIALSRAKSCIVHLSEDRTKVAPPPSGGQRRADGQRAFKGHIVVCISPASGGRRVVSSAIHRRRCLLYLCHLRRFHSSVE